MSNLEGIEAILSDVSGEQYIDRVNGKIDTLMQKLREGDGAVTEEGGSRGVGGGDPPWCSTNYLKECMLALASTDPAAFDPAITNLSAAALRLAGAPRTRDAHHAHRAGACLMADYTAKYGLLLEDYNRKTHPEMFDHPPG